MDLWEIFFLLLSVLSIHISRHFYSQTIQIILPTILHTPYPAAPMAAPAAAPAPTTGRADAAPPMATEEAVEITDIPMVERKKVITATHITTVIAIVMATATVAVVIHKS